MKRSLVLCALLGCATSPPLKISESVALDAWPALPPAVLAELDRAAADHRVFGLGEGDHYVAEKYAYRLALLRPLVERHGLRTLALEMGTSDAARIDRYLETGDEQWLHRVVLWGYAGEGDDERRELAPVTSAQRRPGDDAWAEAERGFFRAVRALRPDGDRMHVFGFDFDATPGGGYADARAALASECEAVRPELTPPRGTSSTVEIPRLQALAAKLATLGCVAASTAIAELALSYQTSIAWRVAAADASPDGPQHLRRMFDEREAHMHERFRRLAPPDARIALLAHDLHVARDSEALRFGRAPHDQPMWASLGTRLEADAPGSVWVAWLLYGAGTRYFPEAMPPRADVKLASGSLEALIAATPGRRWVWTARAGAALDAALPFGTDTSNGIGPVRTVTDAIVYLPRADAP